MEKFGELLIAKVVVVVVVKFEKRLREFSVLLDELLLELEKDGLLGHSR